MALKLRPTVLKHPDDGRTDYTFYCSNWDIGRLFEVVGSRRLRVGVDEDGRRTWRPVHRSSSPIARWLLFVFKGFSNIGSRRNTETEA